MPIHSELRSKIHTLTLEVKKEKDWKSIAARFFILVLELAEDIFKNRPTDEEAKELEDYIVLTWMQEFNTIVPDFLEEPFVRTMVHAIIWYVISKVS